MRMTKEQIVSEIRKTAADNGGIPMGARRLENEAGITKRDWRQYWPRLSDAHVELGFKPNELTKAYSQEELLTKYAHLALELDRLPTEGDLAFKSRNDKGFPSEGVFTVRLGPKEDLIAKLIKHCTAHAEFAEVLPLCEQYTPRRRKEPVGPEVVGQQIGFVYLIRHGTRREYKIGRTNNALRREGEIAIELPQKVQPVHVIKTDDPSGIEAYWHKRFADRRRNGEWFELTAADVASFKRWKKIV